MVQQEDNFSKNNYKAEKGIMGQAVCGAPPLSDPPSPGSPMASVESNGNNPSSPCERTAAEVQETLSSLSAVDGVSKEDLIAKLRTVVTKNLELKETLAQNNLALRHQLALVVRWSQQSQLQKQQQHQNLSRAAMQISALQHENAALKSAAKRDGAASGGDCSAEILALQARLSSAVQQMQQLQQEKDKMDALRARLEGDITLLKCDISTLRRDHERSEMERSHLQAINSKLKQQLRLHHMSLQDQQHAGGEGDEASSELNSTLQREAEAARVQVEALQCDLQRARHKIALLESAAGASKMDMGIPLDQVKLQEEASLLKEDVEVLEKTLAAERIKLAEERQERSKAAAEVTALRTELQEARDVIHRNSNTDQYYQAKIKSINEQHDAVTAKLLSYEELLSAKNDELAKLKKDCGQAKAKLAEFQSEGETISILRAQVEVYQGDFRAEREAREALASEREQLRDDIRQLQHRNTQLLDELQAAQHVTYSARKSGSRAGSQEPQESLTPPPSLSITSRGGDATGALSLDQLSHNLETRDGERSKANEEVLDESLFYCPKCNKSFAELRPLEEHVNRCLDED
ncbi:optineurin isoform X2 [Hyalella azteca]|uniref:Optineurin isoform X2 n=1 Tax=Hyalella azteca TaxID=294128 RepID=A0A8B7N6I7_HYAAZ|nr:optineurin isoform X2 [Hyalella azteca]